MSAEEWARIKTVFGAAAVLHPDERQPFVEAACPDNPAMRSAILELLDNHTDDSPDALAPAAQFLSPAFAGGDLIAGRFRVVAFLARGGMGEVYEVWDERLQQTLALKTLRPDFVADREALERFRREVLLARDVTHDNVCRVFDLVEHHCPGDPPGAAGQVLPCLTMEYLRGETLADLLARKRPLELDLALSIAESAAAGLQELHSHGIIHRDLKPSNLMLTRRRDGSLRPVVMDFGLAKASDLDRNLFETRRDARAGSPYFMAPELLHNAPPGISSDIYSFGLLLDEMVTATRAFAAQSVAALYFSKLCEQPIRPSERASELPSSWDTAILLCLESDPACRPACSARVLEILHGAQPVPAPAVPHAAASALRPGWRRRMITTVAGMLAIGSLTAIFAVKPTTSTVAVFDVENQTEPKYDYLTRGTTSEIIRRLARIQGVRVVPQYTTRRKAGSSQKQIRFAMEGMLQSYNNEIQLFMQVIDNEKGETVWTERYDGSIRDNPLKVQDQIAREATSAVRERILFGDLTGKALHGYRDKLPFQWLLSPPWQRQNPGPTTSAVAFDRYLRARHLIAEVTVKGTHEGIDLLEAAVAEDGGFALAWAALSTAYIGLTDFHDARQSDLIAKAQHAAEQAIRADRSLPEAYMAHAATREIGHDWSGAESSYQQALQLKPTFASARRWYANMMLEQGRFDEAIRSARQARDDDPYDPVSGPTGFGWILFVSGHEEEAVQVLRPATEGREAVGARLNLCQVYARLARKTFGAERENYISMALLEAQTVAQIEARVQQISHGDSSAQVSDQMFALLYSTIGDRDKAEPYVLKLETAMSHGTISPAILAWVYAIEGRQDDAVAALQSAAQSPDRKLLYARVMPYLQSLRGNTKYETLLAGMHL